MTNSIADIDSQTLPNNHRSTTKRRKLDHRHKSLLPGLPDHIAQLSLSLLHPSLLYSVCRTWRRLIYSPSFPPFLSIYALLIPTQTTDQIPHSNSNSNSIQFSSFDPLSSKWHTLPPPPPLRLLLRHQSYISRNLPIQSVSISGNLVLLAATNNHFLPALPRPLIFSPLSKKWTSGPPLATPRRWCAAGTLRGAVYVASGIGAQYSPEVARSLEKWDLQSHRNHNKRNRNVEGLWNWEKMGPLRNGKFSREAIDAVGWRGKLCMVNVKGDAAKEGVVYDVTKDTWEEMAEGMLSGWRGPAAAMEEETIYVVDESKGALRKYDADRDVWEEIVEWEGLRGAEHISAGGGRVCVVCSGGVGIAVVDVVASPPRLIVVDTPTGFQAVGIHILPRMSQPEPDFQQPVWY